MLKPPKKANAPLLVYLSVASSTTVLLVNEASEGNMETGNGNKQKNNQARRVGGWCKRPLAIINALRGMIVVPADEQEKSKRGKTNCMRSNEGSGVEDGWAEESETQSIET